MRHLEFMVAVAGSLSLAGCAALLEPREVKSAEEVERHTSATFDDYKKDIWVYGPWYRDSNLRCCISDGSVNFYQCVLKDVGRGWDFLRDATDHSGRQFEIVHISDEVLAAGWTSETIGIVLPRDYLDEAASGTGIDIRVDGRAGDAYIVLPAFYVQGFLRKNDSALPTAVR